VAEGYTSVIAKKQKEGGEKEIKGRNKTKRGPEVLSEP